MRIPLVLALSLLAGAARADGLDSRRKMPDIEHKTEGWFPDAFPAIGYDSNIGLQLGVLGHITINGSRDDRFFAYTPYRHRFYAQSLFSTGGWQQHMLSYDGIAFADSPFRLKAVVQFERNINANYFGNGESTLHDLSYQGTTFETYDAAEVAAGAHYYHYGYEKPQAQVVLERGFFGGRLRAHYGLNVQHVDIKRYDEPYRFLPSNKLGIDCATGAAQGCAGGWNNVLRAGVALDTRDYEPDPNKGIFVDATGQWSSKAFGSIADYVRLTMAARLYVSPFPKLTDLVLAARVLYSMQSANVPFFAMNTLGMATGIDDATDQTGLGGERTLRGYRQDRFVGHAAVVVNAEVRWTFAKFSLLKQRFSIQISPLFDAGRVFDKVDMSFKDWKLSGGGGLRIGWNQSTIVMLDVGASPEGVNEYVDVGMPF